MKSVLLYVLVVVICAGQEVEDYVAETRGPGGNAKIGYNYKKTKAVDQSLWAAVFPDYCSGDRQSPIDLIPKDAEALESCEPFTFTGYNEKPDGMTITNNGHTAVVNIVMNPMPTVTGGCLTHTYTFEQMHWHWGKTSKKGSEHTIDGEKSPAELHLVHYNSDKYNSIGEAVESNDMDALAVLGVMIKEGEACESCPDPYKKFAKNGDFLKITKKNDVVSLKKPVKLENFLPESLSFYRYFGSLTTPTCNEIVQWTVFKKPVKMLKKQLSYFRKLYDSYGDKLVNNFRKPQPKNGRTVWKYKYD